MIAHPVIKSAGGKTKLLPGLLSRAPTTYGRYYEPFCGGAALFFALCPDRAILGDANADLMDTYRVIATQVEELIGLLKYHASKHSERWYREIVDNWNNHPWPRDSVARAAEFIYLNKTCFNGLWRVNRSGKFNVPMGSYVKPSICMPDELRAASVRLCAAELRSGDFLEILRDVQPGDFVYIDPPYVPASSSANFTGYTVSPFGTKQQTDLRDAIRVMADHGVQVMASNSDTPIVRDLYAGMRIDSVSAPRAINSKGGKRGAVGEFIITAGYEAATEAA